MDGATRNDQDDRQDDDSSGELGRKHGPNSSTIKSHHKPVPKIPRQEGRPVLPGTLLWPVSDPPQHLRCPPRPVV